MTKRSFQGRTWSGKNENVAVDQQQIYQGYRATIASVSAETGIEMFKTYEYAITQWEFAYFLRALIRKNDRPLAVMMDNLNVHKTDFVKAVYVAGDIKPIFNVGYSPEFNGIEAVFSQVKRKYNMERLNKLANDMIFDQTTEIRRAFAKIKPEVVRGCIRLCEAKLRDAL